MTSSNKFKGRYMKMIKRIASVVLTAAMVLPVACCAKNNAAENCEQFEFKEAGVNFDQPDFYKDLQGVLNPSYGTKIDQENGIYYTTIEFYAMPENELMELLQKEELTEEDIELICAHRKEIFNMFAIDNNQTFDDFSAIAQSEYGDDVSNCITVGTVGEYSFFMQLDPSASTPWDSSVEQKYIDEFNNLVQYYSDLSHTHIYEPEEPLTAAPGTVISFETVDINGNTVNSADLFAQNTVTMINIWGTRCGPCVGEMPELVELNNRMQEQNCAVVGIIADLYSLDNESVRNAAEEILTSTGTDYTQLLAWDSISTDLPSEYTPTTYFVDSEGRVIGEAVVGSRTADKYESYFNSAISEVS